MPRASAKVHIIEMVGGKRFNLAVIARNEFILQGNLTLDELALLKDEIETALKIAKMNGKKPS